MPHQRLLHKLDYYGVRGETLTWIQSFLGQRKQRVLLDGTVSSQVDVLSGVPQGTVLGPLLFLAFINDLPECTTSETRLFADDALLFRPIRSAKDESLLQQDLNSLAEWEDKWQMRFNPQKCQVVHVCTNKRYQRRPTYTLHGHVLEAVDSAKYLGVNISDDLSWKTHVDKTAAKASSTLGFLRRNLINCTKEVRERTYNFFVLPTLEYAASVWDPFLTTDINRLEQVQRRGARYVNNNYWDRTPGCVTKMVEDLGWQTLEAKRCNLRLMMLFKIQHGLVDITPGDVLRRHDRRTRGAHRLYQPAASQNVYKFSFYPRTIRQWNALPTAVTDSVTLEAFKVALDDHTAVSSIHH